MFKTEDEMQDKFYNFLKNRELKKKSGRYHFFREIDTLEEIPDVLAFARFEDMVTYELKLNNCMKLWEQGLRNLPYGESYIVLPMDKVDNAVNYFIKKQWGMNAYNHIGIIGFDGEKIKKIKKATTYSEYTFGYLHHKRVQLMQRLIRGFHMDGINSRLGNQLGY